MPVSRRWRGKATSLCAWGTAFISLDRLCISCFASLLDRAFARADRGHIESCLRRSSAQEHYGGYAAPPVSLAPLMSIPNSQPHHHMHPAAPQHSSVRGRVGELQRGPTAKTTSRGSSGMVCNRQTVLMATSRHVVTGTCTHSASLVVCSVFFDYSCPQRP